MLVAFERGVPVFFTAMVHEGVSGVSDKHGDDQIYIL